MDTADFVRSVKTVTGQNLDWFFDQWLFKPGHPVFEIRSEWDPARKAVRLKVAQVQDFARGVPVFRVPVSVKIVTAGGAATHRVWIRDKEETFEFPAETKPLLVRFDADERADQGGDVPQGDGRAPLPAQERRRHRPDGRGRRTGCRG